jgi:O-antigen ligase
MFMLFAMGLMSRKYGLLFVAALLLVMAPLVMPPEVIDRVNYTFTGPETNEVTIFGFITLHPDSSTMERIHVWKKVAFSFIRSPFIGYGLTYQQILDSQFARLLVEVGAIGSALFIWILIRIFKCAWYVLHHATSWMHRALALGYLAAFIGVIVHSLGAITFYIVRIMEPFWFFTALVVYLYLYTKNREESGELAAAVSPAKAPPRRKHRVSS